MILSTPAHQSDADDWILAKVDGRLLHEETLRVPPLLIFGQVGQID